MDTRVRRGSDGAKAWGRGRPCSGAGGTPALGHSAHELPSLGGGKEVDVAARHVGSVGAGDVPAYTAVDFRYAWRVSRYFDLYFVAQNLFDPLHLEYVSTSSPASRYKPRRAFIQGVWRF